MRRDEEGAPGARRREPLSTASHLRIFVPANILRCVSQIRQFKASIFQALAHPTRLEILEALRGGEMCVNDILARIDRGQANISQHLTTLRLRGLVVNRKAGNQVFYSVRDRVLFKVLDQMRDYSRTHLRENMTSLRRLRSDVSRG